MYFCKCCLFQLIIQMNNSWVSYIYNIVSKSRGVQNEKDIYCIWGTSNTFYKSSHMARRTEEGIHGIKSTILNYIKWNEAWMKMCDSQLQIGHFPFLWCPQLGLCTIFPPRIDHHEGQKTIDYWLGYHFCDVAG